MMTNIDFLIKVLDKQFSLANCTKTTAEVMEMTEYEQTKFWEEYTLTPSQFDEWKQFFLDNASENEEFTLPKWAIEEVTGDKRYYNAYLAKTPYKSW